MKASEFDADEDISAVVDWTNTHRPNDQPKRVNVDFPVWVVDLLDRIAERVLGAI